MSTIDQMTLKDFLNARLQPSMCNKCGAHLELRCPNKHCIDCGAAIYNEGELCSTCIIKRQCLVCDSSGQKEFKMTCGKLVTVEDVFKQIYSNLRPNCTQCERAQTTRYESQLRCGAYWDKKTLSVYFNKNVGVFMWIPSFDCPLGYENTTTAQTMKTMARNIGWLDDEPSSMPGGIGI